MLLAQKVELLLNNKQENFMRRAAGTARWAYNWGLEEWKRQYEAGEKPTYISLRNSLTKLKNTDETRAWIGEVGVHIYDYALRNLDKAFKNFFAKRSKYPKFKKRGLHDSFAVDYRRIKPDVDRMGNPTINVVKLGTVRIAVPLRFSGQIKSGKISRIADKWFLSVVFDVAVPEAAPSGGRLGIDMGISSFIATSDGKKVDAPQFLVKGERKLRVLQKSLSRSVRGSKNRAKARMKVARQHRKIAFQRQAFLHNLTTRLTRTKGTIVVETLNVKGMLRDGRLSKAISDASWGEFIRQLEYKGQLHGCRISKADQWYASSKLCSRCGHKLKELPLSVRSWSCPNCGASHDRDINAAKNLLKYSTGVAPGSGQEMAKACGDGSPSTLRRRFAASRSPSVKQEGSR